MRNAVSPGKRLQLALNTGHMSIWDSRVIHGKVVDGIIYWSNLGMALLGGKPGKSKQKFSDFLATVHPDDQPGLVKTMQDAVDARTSYRVDYRVIWPDGSVHWLSARADVIVSKRSLHTLGIVWDDTPRKLAEAKLVEQRDLAQVTLNSIGDGVITTDAAGYVDYLNRIAEELTGWSNEDIRRHKIHIEDVFPVVDREGQVIDNIAVKALQSHESVGISPNCLLLARDGRRIPVEDSASPIRTEDGHILGAVLVFHDVSHERALKSELQWQAAHDALTGLINRREFERHVTEALASAKSDYHQHALLFMDLDQFKIVNDTCGHYAGDVLLKTLTKILQSHIRDGDILARLGGDELGVLLLNCPQAQAMVLAEKLRQSVKEYRFTWQNSTFEIGVSIGFVMVDHDSKSTSELLSAADQACYAAKEHGRNRVHVYHESDAMVARRHGEMRWVSRLNEALENHHFVLYAQPIAALSDDLAPRSEILLRLHNGNQVVLPGAFIPAAERYDLMPVIDRWVIDTAFRSMREYSEQRPPDASAPAGLDLGQNYSINLSGVSLNDETLYDYIVDKLRHYAIDPSRICFEVTETAVINNLAKAHLFMEKAKELGCKFSLDDFGIGLSSFAYLKQLPVDYLKIDGLFVRDITTNIVNRAMVSAINDVGHVMGLKTIAEFVETDEVLDEVRKIGLDFAQGYAVGALQPLDGR